MPRKKTNEEFLLEVKNLVGNEYIFTEKYDGATKKIGVIHTKCNHKYLVKPSEFLKGSRCPKCFGTFKKTTDEFKEDVYRAVKDEYSVLGEYMGNKEKILMRHNVCNHEYEVTPSNFLSNKRRCPKCFGSKKKTTEEFKKEVYNLVENDYLVLGQYINNSEKIKMKHVNCGHEYSVRPSDFLNGKRCPNCFKNEKKTQKQFEDEVREIYGDEYEVVGKYEGANIKIKIKHKDCGRIFKVRPIAFLRGSTCIYCTDYISKGARKVRDFLDINKIDYFPEYIFKDLKYKNYLRFDFAIMKDDKLLGLIEYHGEQHYEGSMFNNESLEERQLKDRLKEAYCICRDIPLLVISYKDMFKYKDMMHTFLNQIDLDIV